MLVPWSLIYSASSAVSTHTVPSVAVHLFQGQVVCVTHRRHETGALHKCGDNVTLVKLALMQGVILD